MILLIYHNINSRTALFIIHAVKNILLLKQKALYRYIFVHHGPDNLNVPLKAQLGLLISSYVP